jgi:single-strand DNA-binding protein
MASLNKACLIGYLGVDPDVRYLPDGAAIATVRLATTDRWKDSKTGERKEKTEWHRVIFYKWLAEVVRDYLKKGAPIYVEGKIRTQKWTDQQGVDRYTTEIVASELQMLGKKDATAELQESGSDAALQTTQGGCSVPLSDESNDNIDANHSCAMM